jgi:D-lactate dehydrogenase
MKIVIFETEPWEQDAFAPLRKMHDMVMVKDPLTEKNATDYQDADIVSTFIYSKLNCATFEKFKNLKLIATRSTGISHIDIDACNHHDIAIANVPTYGKNTVAEHAFGLLLAISHNIVEGVDRVRKGDFDFRGLRGFDLRGKIIGIIGTGDIGEHAIKIALGFDMKVIAFDVKPRNELTEQLRFEYVDLDTLLAHADIISMHVPGIPQTKDLIGEEEFQKMKFGAVLINTSRGSVVNIQAMVKALANGTLKAAGLDVLPEEPIIREEAELLRTVYHKQHERDLVTLLADNALMRMQNVLITPHNAFFTSEAVERILATTVKNIKGFIEGEPKNIAAGKV